MNIYTTESERIVNSGLLTADYFNEEIKCDFLVNTQRKKIWAVLLDLLLMFDSVCKKYGLTYYLIEGSLLGAVRHHGFVPWDDDIDVAMPREDYNRFMDLSDEFVYPYFLQTPYTDEGNYLSFIKLRNTNTTGMSEVFKYQPINHGLFIDIFPLDKWELDDGEERYEHIKSLIIDVSTYMRMSHPNLDEKNLVRVREYSGHNPMDTYEAIQKYATEFSNVETEYVCLAVCTYYDYKRHLYFKEDFKSVVYTDFEGFSFPIPVGYDRILKTTYGDYTLFPPIHERGLRHDDIIFDPDTPYKDYLDK